MGSREVPDGVEGPALLVVLVVLVLVLLLLPRRVSGGDMACC